MSHPAAYLRRSYVDPNAPGDISREAQREAVRRLAVKDGHNGNLREYDDWGVSADVAKSAKRTAYAQLLADMEAGRVTHVYAFDVDRLYRDPRDLMRLQDAAARHNVKITTTAGQLPIGEGDDPAAEAFAFIGAVFGRMELQKSKKRNRAARDARIARGDDMGRPAWGFQSERQPDGSIRHVPDPSKPVPAVLQAVREAGSILGAVKLLNSRKIAGPRGGTWHPSALARVVERHAPELLPRKGPTGRRQPTRALFAQLLRCHCGQVLTPNLPRRQYYCNIGHRVGHAAHGKYNVREQDLQPWVAAEVARFRPPQKVARAADDGRRAALEAKRDDLGWALINGTIRDRDTVLREQAKIDAAIEGLEAEREAVTVPARVDWERWAPTDINEYLRTVIDHVQLDADMRPVAAEWRIPPEWLR